MANGHPASSIYQPHWRYPPKLKGLSGIYLNAAIRNLAFGLMSIFIPIYIYKIAGSLASVFLFFSIWQAVQLVAIVPVAKLISKIGPDISMLTSNITRSIYLIFLVLAASSPLFLWAAPIFGSITVPLYWLPYHTAFSSQSKRKKLSRQLAAISNITRLATIFAPLLGGFIADKFGFGALFPIGIFLLIASSLPIFLDEYNKKEPIYSLPELGKYTLAPKNRGLFTAFLFQGIESVANSTAWPLILYFALPDLEKIGELTTFTLIVSLITINWLAKRLNQFETVPLVLGNIIKSFAWLLRAITASPLLISVSDPIYQLASIPVDLPYNILIYQQGEKHSLSFFVERELAIHGGAFLSSFIIFLLLFFGIPWPAIALLAIWGVNLMTIFLIKFANP